MLKLAFAVIKLITMLMEWSEQRYWLNEGERRLQARQLMELTHALAKAAHIENEWKSLTDDEVLKRFETEGWFAE